MKEKIYLKRDECILLLRRAITNGTIPYGISVVEEWMEGADNRISELEAALREIAEHPHCDKEATPWGTLANRNDDHSFRLGHADGHRCCTEIARKALESK